MLMRQLQTGRSLSQTGNALGSRPEQSPQDFLQHAGFEIRRTLHGSFRPQDQHEGILRVHVRMLLSPHIQLLQSPKAGRRNKGV
jgi:hypothetical protein